MAYDPKQYNNPELAVGYLHVVETDPVKRYVQDPELFRMLGDVRGLDILDVGCGNGRIAKQIVEKGARDVVAFDISETQLAIAHRTNPDTRIGYVRRDFCTIRYSREFDKAVAAMVLPYASSLMDLGQAFHRIYTALRVGGTLVAIVLNCDFWKPGKIAYNRHAHNDGFRFDFLDQKGGVLGGVTFEQMFSPDEYNDAARQAGFQTSWEILQPSTEGRNALGPRYWKNFISDAPYLGLVATKTRP